MNDFESIWTLQIESTADLYEAFFLYICIAFYILYILRELRRCTARCFFESQGSRRRFIVCDYKNL